MCSYFRTGSFATGVKFVDGIGKVADAANHHPDVDLRYSGVTVRLTADDVDGLSQRDVELARQIPRAPAWWGWQTPRATRPTWRPGWGATEQDSPR
jgi:pterin-4a-carbinolamine dehydratase